MSQGGGGGPSGFDDFADPGKEQGAGFFRGAELPKQLADWCGRRGEKSLAHGVAHLPRAGRTSRGVGLVARQTL